MTDFIEFPKMPRLTRNCVITEKLDGTNASIFIGESGEFLTGSRTRWITPDDDNFGFSRWCHDNKEELLALGSGHHFGEWWGHGIQRNYGLKEKRFSLFNTGRWNDETKPKCCYVVPVLYMGVFNTQAVSTELALLESQGSKAAPSFMKPEGIIVWHEAARIGFKKTIEKDESPKSLAR